MLFNLSKCRHFPNKQTGKAILCDSSKGPCFSGGDFSDLSAVREPFNGNLNCFSLAKMPGFEIPLDESGRNMLTD